MQPKITFWHRMIERLPLEQHKPKLDKLYIPSESESFSTTIVEDVIIHQPQDEDKIKGEESKSLLLAAGLRIVGLILSVFAARLFLSHYVTSDGIAFQHFNLSSQLWQVFIVLLALMVARMVAQLRIDRNLPFEQIRGNATKVFTKPFFSYLGWTFLFFVFGALGQTWFRWPAAWFILMSTSHIKFQTGWMRFVNMPVQGGFRSSSYKT
jgi:hypothetical protein